MTTKIMSCTCTHSFQDKKHGKGRRVFNQMKGDPPRYACTICGTQKGAPAETKTK